MDKKTDKQLDDAWDAAVDTFASSEEKPESNAGTWVYCAIEDKFVRKEDRVQAQDSAMIMKGMEAFKSPIDGSIITDRAKLRAHNKKHGVTNTQDYGDAYFKRRGREMHNESIGNTKQAKAERLEALQQQFYNHGITR